ncbi:hypothetical protein EJP77_18595 [Paenibacillus zeisoli]|uniref:Uncharacterized protein n=1 Tax=Paenibacillus zeisoli TaxID=2496267 RepID=A0A433X1M1_9BACL|nr:hypothetical protein [Paenibacillus zeisoli]RUT28026.1 hypothetical protein EJP77_18595 [Paenibacillus zeisoli]
MHKKYRVFFPITFTLFILISGYVVLDKFLVLDRTDRTLGIYDFASSIPDIELLVEGSGGQEIEGGLVSTQLKILKIDKKLTSLNFSIGAEIKGYEYFDVHTNREVSWIPLFPGRSIYSMGTSYKKIREGEERQVYLNYDEHTGRLWLMPKELIK